MDNQALELSKRLIAIPSTKDNTKALKEVLVEAGKSLEDVKNKKFEIKGTPSIIYYTTSNIPKKFKVILNAHLDVVPAKELQYKPNVKGDKLYGRGAYDMKATAAAEILVFKEIAKKVNYPLGLQLVTDEEIGGFNGTKYQIDKGIRSDFVIAGEPTDFGINNKAKGIIWAKVKAKGKAAHGAYVWQGENAIWKLNQFLNNLSKAYTVPKKEEWRTTVNLAKVLTSNETFNKVPDEAEAWLDIRYISEESESIVNNLKKLLPKSVDVEVQLKEPAHFTDQNNKYVKLLRESTKKVTGKLSPVIVKHGGSDIRHFNKVGCDGVTFGPKGYGLHTDNEWVDIKSLEQYYEILKTFLLSLK